MSLKTELKDFQKKTLEWMIDHEKKYDGGMLFNQPGLGKSLDVLATVCKDTTPLKTLIICPSGIIDNWIDEIKKHTNISKLKIVKYYGTKRHNYINNDKHLIYITSYSIVAREFNKGKFDNESILDKKVNFDRIVLDEAHYIRNTKSNVYKSIIYLSDTLVGIKKWIVTATPIFNDPMDTYAYFKFLNLEGIDSRADWTRVISKNINGLHILNGWIKKYSLSYKKSDVLKELKNKNHENLQLEFNELEKSFYDALREYSVSRLNSLVDRIKRLNKDVFSNNSMKQILHTNVMVYILRLKQACNSPLLVLQCMKRLKGITNMTKAVEKLQYYNQSKEREEECPICYDSTADHIADPCGHKCCEECWNKLFNTNIVHCPVCRTYVDKIENVNKNPTTLPVPSTFEMNEIKETSKIKYTIDLIKDVIKKDEKIVVVSQWVSMLNIMRNVVDDELPGVKYVSLQGDVSMKNRSKLIYEFQNNNSIKICFVSLMSSAEGINLTAANHLVLTDSWWNESKIIQVTDRIHRIGQMKQVNIYNLQIKDTIEEQIQKLITKKSKMSKIVLSKWEIDNKNYDDSWMHDIVKLINN